MIKDVSIFRVCRLAVHLCRRNRHIAYIDVAFFQFGFTIIVEECNFILRRRILFPCSRISGVSRNSCNSRTPYEGMTDLSRRVLADRHLVMGQEMTLNLQTTFLLEDNRVFTRFLRIGSRIGYITRHRTEHRSPAREIIRIVDISGTRRVRTEELCHGTVGDLVTIYKCLFRTHGLNDIAIPVFPCDGEFFLLPFVFTIIPIVIGVIFRMETMVEVIFFLYFPPLAVALQDEETSCTGSIAEGMIVISDYIILVV